MSFSIYELGSVLALGVLAGKEVQMTVMGCEGEGVEKLRTRTEESSEEILHFNNYRIVLHLFISECAHHSSPSSRAMAEFVKWAPS